MFIIGSHSTIDKKFEFSNEYVSMQVDYDDVNHIEVDVAIEYIKEILDKNWNNKLFEQRLKERNI
jgi:hypothetical protein